MQTLFSPFCFCRYSLFSSIQSFVFISISLSFKRHCKKQKYKLSRTDKISFQKKQEKKKGFAWGGDGYLFGLKGRVTESYHCRQRYAVFIFIPFIFVVMVINQITQKKLSKILKTEDRSPYWKLTSEVTTALLGGPKYTL